MSGAAWVSIQRRAAACRATVLRTDPADGQVRYLCSWGDRLVFYTFTDLAPLSQHLVGVEEKNAEWEREMRTSRRVTAEEERIYSLQGRIGGLGAAIFSHTRQLTGEVPIGRSTLVMAQADGRNHLKDLESKRVAAIRERLRLADELAALGKKPRRYAEYLAAVKELDAPHTGGAAK